MADMVGASGDASVLIKWLCLAATPTFAVMALLTAVADRGAMALLCSAGRGFPLGGMAPMYLLMSLFHCTPWLKLIGGLIQMRRAATRTGLDR